MRSISINEIIEVLKYIPESYDLKNPHSPPCILSKKLHEIITRNDLEIERMLKLYIKLQVLYFLRLAKDSEKDVDFMYDYLWVKLKSDLNNYIEKIESDSHYILDYDWEQLLRDLEKYL